jgi:Family of unknown function (DUF6084)
MSLPEAALLRRPEPEFSVVGAEHEAHAAAPTLVFTLQASESQQLDVYTIALSVQIQIDPARRTYDEATRERLVDLFGEAERWAGSLQSFLWTTASVLVPSFKGETTFELPVPCTYDLEVAATKYFYSLPGGTVPLSFFFTGTVFYRDDEGRLQLVLLPWSCSARYRLPVGVWERMIAAHYSGSGWLSLHRETLDRLARLKAERGHSTFDAVVAELLEERA